MAKKIKLIVLASGSGTTFKYLAKHPFLDVIFLLTDRKNCEAIEHSKKLNIPFKTICPKDYLSHSLWDQDMTKTVQIIFKNQHLIVLAGFLSRLGSHFLSMFKNQIINSHPALLPNFGGHGMYGIHVHRAVLQAKKKTTGVTIHYVNEEYDQGEIIAQKKIKVFPSDTPESLEKRVKKEEKPFYSETIIKKFSKI